MRFRKNQTAGQSRTGFTLIEVLVVIGIIAILATLLLMAVGPALENAKINATRVTLNQINDVIQQRVDAINRLDVSAEAKKIATLNSISELQATFLIKTNLYRQALPQRIQDLYGLDGSNGGSDNAPLLSQWGFGVPDTNTEYTSSALLYAALTAGSQLRALPSGKSYTVPTLDAGSINSKHLTTVPLSSADLTVTTTAFIDAWESPLRFYNWPTRLIRPNGSTIDITNAKLLISGLSTNTSNSGPLGTDPFDPQQKGSSPFTSGGTLTYAPSATISYQAFNESNYHTLNTYFVPLLISAGPDQTLGLYEPSYNSSNPTNHLGVVSDQSSMFDDITNRQQ